MSVFDIDKNIESIDGNIQEHKRKQLKPNQYSKCVSVINDLKYIIDPFNGELVYVVESNELYMYENKWIKIQSPYGNI